MRASFAPSWSAQETICDHQSEGGPRVTHVRGTLLVSSLQILRETGHYDRYVANLPPASRERVLYTIALSWVPVDLAMVHYSACDALGLNDAQLNTVGELVADRLAKTLLGAVLRTSRGAGMNAPWVALRSQPRIWDRIYIGGGVALWRTGPKDAVAEFYGLPLAQFHYFRVAYCAYYRGLASLFVRSPVIKPARAREPKPDTFAITGSWV